MQEALIRIVQMLNVIHSENMAIMTMLCGKQSEDIVKEYGKMFKDACGVKLDDNLK